MGSVEVIRGHYEGTDVLQTSLQLSLISLLQLQRITGTNQQVSSEPHYHPLFTCFRTTELFFLFKICSEEDNFIAQKRVAVAVVVVKVIIKNNGKC